MRRLFTQALTAREMLGMAVAILVMTAGILTFAVFTATLTSGLNAATARRLRGLRRIHRPATSSFAVPVTWAPWL